MNKLETEQIMNEQMIKREVSRLMGDLMNAREKRGLTQKEVALRSGLSQQAVSRMECLTNLPTLTNLVKYMSALNVKLEVVQEKEEDVC